MIGKHMSRNGHKLGNLCQNCVPGWN